MSAVHTLAAAGFGTGKGDHYNRSRPSYPSQALSSIRSALRGAAPFNVLELGAGTGIFTRALLAHPEWQDSVRELKAVEPSADFRATFVATVQDSRVSIGPGTFDQTGAEDAWADLIVVAQAFHWCPDYNAALKEFARVLRPDGVAVLIWNLEDGERATWVRRLRDIVESYEQGTPQFHRGYWRQTFSEPAYLANFAEQEILTFLHVVPTTEKGVLDRAASKSFIAILEDAEKQGVLDNLRRILHDESKTWIDEKQGVFEYPYTTTVVLMRKK